jgi:outer membrane protein OmpA-like peptidoglycan-associated protein
MRIKLLSLCFLLGLSVEAKPKEGAPSNVHLYTPEVKFSEAIFFDYNKDTIKQLSFAKLDDLAKILQADTTLSFEVVIHQKKPKSSGYARHLTKIRAQALIDYLIEKGEVSAERFKIVWYEERCPPSGASKEEADTRLIDFVLKRDDISGCRPYAIKP